MKSSLTLAQIAAINRKAAWRHGTRSSYVGSGCRCPDCTSANAAYERARYRGKPRNTLPLAKVREDANQLDLL